VRREAAARYVARAGLPVAHDPTNDREDLARTRARRFLAALGALGGDEGAGATRALVEVAARSAAAAEDCERSALALGPVEDLAAPDLARAPDDVLRALLRRAGLHRAGASQVAALRRLCAARAAGSRAVDLGGGLVGERRYDRVRLGAPPPPDPGDLLFPVDAAGAFPWPPGGVVVVGAGEPGAPGALPPGLCLRNARPGDRLRTRAGRRKLQDVLTDVKIPRSLRRRLPLLCVGADVLWLALAAPPPAGGPAPALAAADVTATAAGPSAVGPPPPAGRSSWTAGWRASTENGREVPDTPC